MTGRIFCLIIFSLFITAFRMDDPEQEDMNRKINEYSEVTLKADISGLSVNEKEMIRLFFKASDIMDSLFWLQSYGDKNNLLSQIDNEDLKKLIKINYGPWDRLNGNVPFLISAGTKPKGANFYPADITEVEFSDFADPTKTSQYTIIRRSDKGNLISVAYHKAYASYIREASELLMKASELSEDESLKKYLILRAEALLTDNYQPSDIAWMDMKENRIDFVIGPIENYEDQLFGYKAAYEAYILLKDQEWSARLKKFAFMLPELQKKLPVEPEYKNETPGSSSDLGVYDVLYYAGDCNAGSKTIAINLPNDEEVQLKKGSRRLQLRNAMHAKFNKILMPIASELIAEEQNKNISFNAFFENILFHEVAHGLGVKITIDEKQTVREALKDTYSILEEGKADILGLFLVNELYKTGMLDEELMNNYTTFLAGIFRSIRFGASNAHGQANLIQYNYFIEADAFVINALGKYSVNPMKLNEAIEELSHKIITIQGNGDYEAAQKLIKEYAVISPELQESLDRINNKQIPVDIIFKQGIDLF